MIKNMIEISKDQLISEAHKMMISDYRLITATCFDTGNEAFDVIYHFDKELEMKHYRIKVQKNEGIPSISNIYFCAFLVENEMRELFGLNVENMVLDYGGHLLLTGDELNAPMAKQQIAMGKKEEK